MEEVTQQIVEEVNEVDSVDCIGFYFKDNTSLENNTVEEDIKIFGQAAGDREEGHGTDRMKGGRTARSTGRRASQRLQKGPWQPTGPQAVQTVATYWFSCPFNL